jgi:hypothetical protein
MIDLDKSRGMLVEVIAENVDLRGHDHPDRPSRRLKVAHRKTAWKSKNARFTISIKLAAFPS